MPLSRRIALGSLAVSLIVLLIKSLAYHVTGSVALFSDALESVINVVTAIAALAAIRYSAEPADEKHPYGHHKAEYLSAVIVGVLIVLAGLAILREAWSGFLAPKPIDAPLLGLAISGVATVLNAGWCAVLIRQGRKNHSPALVADGKHLLADVITSAGVVLGVGLVVVTGVQVLDSIIAGVVALHVLWSGWKVMQENSGSLLDEAAPEDQLAIIRQVLGDHSGDAIEYHDLRTRYASRTTFIDLHLVVSGDMTVARSHDICGRIEQALTTALDHAVVTIHVEPEHKAERADAGRAEPAPAPSSPGQAS
jgi:cation diffusion facilitator family transporter